MSDYISKSKLIEEIKKQKDDNDMHCRLCMDAMIEIADELPTVDEKGIIRKTVERIVERLEYELKWTRAEQTIECERHNGYGSPLQSKNSGRIEALKKAIKICKEEGGTSV